MPSNLLHAALPDPATMIAAIREERARRTAEREGVERAREIAADVERIRADCQSLVGFVREAWHVVEPSANYVHGWHIDAICSHLEAVTSGEITRLLINVPPGTMKSLLCGVFWPAWEWGPKDRPQMRYLGASYSEHYAKRDNRRMRDLVASEWYQALWGDRVKLTRTGENWFDLLPGPAEVNWLLDALEGEVGLNGDFGNWDRAGKYEDLARIMSRAELCHAKGRYSGNGLDRADYIRCVELSVVAGYRGPFTLIYDSDYYQDEWQGILDERDCIAGELKRLAGA